MGSSMGTFDGTGDVDVVLTGGPVDLPDTHRRRRAVDADYEIKVPHLGGYEHFERTEETAEATGSTLRIYRWTMRTLIAE
jgi:uncharacterized protein DUF5988